MRLGLDHIEEGICLNQTRTVSRVVGKQDAKDDLDTVLYRIGGLEASFVPRLDRIDEILKMPLISPTRILAKERSDFLMPSSSPIQR
jgi:hypothetical protein